MTHTPGPWRASDTTYPDVWDIVTDDDATLVVSDAHSRADAHLVAAAPELLAALVALKDHIADGMTFTSDGAGWQPDDLPLAQLMTTAEEAIAKATGADL